MKQYDIEVGQVYKTQVLSDSPFVENSKIVITKIDYSRAKIYYNYIIDEPYFKAERCQYLREFNTKNIKLLPAYSSPLYKAVNPQKP